MKRPEARDNLMLGLGARGFRKTGRFWTMVGNDLQWIVYPEMNPRGGLSVTLGAMLDIDSAPVSPNYCAVYVSLESLPFARTLEAAIALTLDSPSMSDVERAAELVHLGEQLGTFAADRSSISALLIAYRAGDFRGFVHPDVRNLAETDDRPE